MQYNEEATERLIEAGRKITTPDVSEMDKWLAAGADPTAAMRELVTYPDTSEMVLMALVRAGADLFRNYPDTRDGILGNEHANHRPFLELLLSVEVRERINALITSKMPTQTLKEVLSSGEGATLFDIACEYGCISLQEFIRPKLFPNGLTGAYQFLFDNLEGSPTCFVSRFSTEAGEKAWKRMMRLFNEYFLPSKWEGREQDALKEYRAFMDMTPDYWKPFLDADVDITAIRRVAEARERTRSPLKQLLKRKADGDLPGRSNREPGR